MKLPLLSSFADLALVASVLGLSHDRGHTQSRHIVLWDSKENQNAVVDALIIGGGPGGLAVAAALARQRHSSRIFDSGEYRNAKAKEMHNVLGWDGANPADYRKKARDDLLRNYPELVVYIPQSVTGLNTLEDDGAVVYTAVTDRGQIFQGRKVVFAQGMTEKFPDIKGYEDCWAHGIIHCLFCHGYEERDRGSAGVLALDGPAKLESVLARSLAVLQLEQAARVYTNGDEETAALLRNRTDHIRDKRGKGRLHIETTPIKRLSLLNPENSDVVVQLENGKEFREAFIYHAPSLRIRGNLHEQLDARLEPNIGSAVVLALEQRGIYLSGDIANQGRAGTYAPATGAKVAARMAETLQFEALKVPRRGK